MTPLLTEGRSRRRDWVTSLGCLLIVAACLAFWIILVFATGYVWRHA